MPLRTGRMEKRSAAVEYAVKAYKGKGKVKNQPATDSSKTLQPKPDEVRVVKIKKQPVKRALEKIRRYFT